jgi:hypothetical protein
MLLALAGERVDSDRDRGDAAVGLPGWVEDVVAEAVLEVSAPTNPGSGV